ncbi:MAG: DUF507 family protein [Myxococcota bacterium]
MRLYRRVVPVIAQNLIDVLRKNEAIEIKDGQEEEAALDLAAVMVQHLDEQDLLTRETQEAMTKRGIGMERFSQVRKSIAEARKIKVGTDAFELLCNDMLQTLFESDNIVEVFAQDPEILKVVKETILRYTTVPEEIDVEARSRIKNLREGTLAWETEYFRILSYLKRQKGLE